MAKRLGPGANSEVTNRAASAYKPRENMWEEQEFDDELVIPAGVEPAFPT